MELEIFKFVKLNYEVTIDEIVNYFSKLDKDTIRNCVQEMLNKKKLLYTYNGVTINQDAIIVCSCNENEDIDYDLNLTKPFRKLF